MMNDGSVVDKGEDAKGVFSTLVYKPTDGRLFDFNSRSSQAYHTYCPEEAPCCMELDKTSQDVRCGDDDEGTCKESCAGDKEVPKGNKECIEKNANKPKCCE